MISFKSKKTTKIRHKIWEKKITFIYKIWLNEQKLSNVHVQVDTIWDLPLVFKKK